MNKIKFFIAVFLVGAILIFFVNHFTQNTSVNQEVFVSDTLSKGAVDTIVYWTAADITSIADAKQKELVLYGKELIAHTAKYFGPKGTVKAMSNGMNCQNCHLNAGTKVFGNNYGSVASMYPKFRPRSGSVENIYKRII